MKRLLLLASFFLCFAGIHAQNICNPNGNLVIYSNYDGGVLNIVVDQNIPNLKIGVVAYESVAINISGAFAGNVSGLVFAGFPSGANNNCGAGGPSGSTSVSGINSSLVNILDLPAVNYNNSNGNASMVCAYSCDTSSNQGGCNTVDQVVAFFLSQFSGSIFRSHLVQYDCWLQTEQRLLSQGGNCCIAPEVAPVADFSMFNDTICAESCISFTDLSSGNPTSWSWVFQGGTPPTSTNQNPSNICFQDPGTYTINLSAGNGSGTGAVNKIITVQPKPIFTQQPLSASAAIGSQHRFTVALSASGNQFQWQSNQGAGFVNLMNGGQYSGVNNDTLTISNLSTGNQNQSFRCVAGNSSNCYDTSEVAVLNVVNNTGMQELLDAGVSLSPNPASNQLVLEMKKMPAKQYQIYDLSGRMILQGSIQQNKTIIPVSDFIPGSYLLRIPEIPSGAWPFIKE